MHPRTFIWIAVLWFVGTIPAIITGMAIKDGVREILHRDAAFSRGKKPLWWLVVLYTLTPLASMAFLIRPWAQQTVRGIIEAAIDHPDNKVTFEEARDLRRWVEDQW
jgi:H+/Cl- antiporter ClcA